MQNDKSMTERRIYMQSDGFMRDAQCMHNRGRAALPAPRKDSEKMWASAPVLFRKFATLYPQQN